MDDSVSTGIVFTDVDGTFVGSDHHAIMECAPVVRRIATRVPLCLVSARSPEGLYPIQRDLGFVGPLACYSGAYVLDEKGVELFSCTMTFDVAMRVKGVVNATFESLTVGMYGFHDWIVDDVNDERIQHEQRLVQTTARKCADLVSVFGARGVHKLLVMGEPSQIMEAESILQDEFPMLNVVRSSSTLCEIMSKEVNKGHAVRLLCEHYGLSASQAIAFGDGPNDIDMLNAVGRSYAMANAEESVKQAATQVLPWSNVECGVARALEAMNLA